jgi:polygalacturonase
LDRCQIARRIRSGKTLDTPFINAAIAECSANGGGVVYLAPGTYLSGTILLRSNVTLHLEAGATLLGSRYLRDYEVTLPGGLGAAAERHLIFARDVENVGLAGAGRIDGQGEHFWTAVTPTTVPEDAARDIAANYWKQTDRPSPLVEFTGCRNVRIENVRIDNAPGWTLRTINCAGVFIRGISMNAPMIAAGIVPTCCRDVVISDCILNTGDDPICLKSENPYGDTVGESRNIAITNCVLSSYYDGLKIGSATHGVIENVTFSNSIIVSRREEMKHRVLTGIAIEMVDGGALDGVQISNVRMQNVRAPFLVRLGNRTPRKDGSFGSLRNVSIDGVHAVEAYLTSTICGIPHAYVENVRLSNVQIQSNERGSADWSKRTVPEQETAYPESLMFGRLPAFGMYVRHARGVHLRDVEFRAVAGEGRPPIVYEDVAD